MKKGSVNKFGKFWCDENEIFNFKFHEGAVIDLEAAQFLVNERIKLFDGRHYPYLLDIIGVKEVSKPALNYFSSEDGIVLVNAAAILVSSFLNKMLGNYYLKLFPPNIPTRLFTNKEEAIKWLSLYK